MKSMTSRTHALFTGSLITLTLMILGMVIIGGITRLTGSGLSIVEWKPITGFLPPLTRTDWVNEFGKYQQSPEFLKINFGMTLSEFQSIFWLEYIHRLWGRLLGFVLLIPTLIVVFKSQYRPFWPSILGLWALGAAQGLMGWLMVKSGLVHDPHVSPYRLAFHLLLGLTIFGMALWLTFLLFKEKLKTQTQSFANLKMLTLITITFLILTIFMGALVAGFKAGLVYNTFPLMGNRLIPAELFSQAPWWLDLFENPVSIQFTHRLLAICTVGLCLGLYVTQRKLSLPPLVTLAFESVALLALVQLTLGILTLVFQVPLVLAILHQGVAFLLFGSLLFSFFLVQNRAN